MGHDDTSNSEKMIYPLYKETNTALLDTIYYLQDEIFSGYCSNIYIYNTIGLSVLFICFVYDLK
jgi:hypothetical protein